jgi:ferrous iron transport protein A
MSARPVDIDFHSQQTQRDGVTLDQLEDNRPAKIAAVDTRDAVILRLMEMGLVPGASVAVKKRAPFGGPLQLRVGDYLLSIRAGEARAFSVEPAP